LFTICALCPQVKRCLRTEETTYMISLGISILWFALGVILVAACIYAAIWGISQFVPIDGRIIKLVWVVFAILCMIYLLITIEGGGSVSGFRPLFPRS
jgi:hypothetical protein